MADILPNLTFSDDALQRYSRHILLPEVGGVGQARLRDSSVLVIGAGGLGSPIVLYLAAAGVGRIGIVDYDTIELSNLQRQILFEMKDLGKSKAEIAGKRLNALNPEIRVDTHILKAETDNLSEIIAEYDLVCDGSDNFPTRYAVADCCWSLGKTLVSGAVQRFEGLLTTFISAEGKPCYRCLYPDAEETDALSCGQAGIFGSVTGVIGSLMATEALKELLAIGTGLAGRVLVWRALESNFSSFTLAKDPACQCHLHRTRGQD